MGGIVRADFMRTAILSAESEGELLDSLEHIPGWELLDAKEEGKSFHETQKFVLRSKSGQEILVTHKDGESTARTASVYGQDDKDEPTPVADDALVALRKAAVGVNGLSVEVTLSDHDMGVTQPD